MRFVVYPILFVLVWPICLCHIILPDILVCDIAPVAYRSLPHVVMLHSMKLYILLYHSLVYFTDIDVGIGIVSLHDIVAVPCCSMV